MNAFYGEVVTCNVIDIQLNLVANDDERGYRLMVPVECDKAVVYCPLIGVVRVNGDSLGA